MWADVGGKCSERSGLQILEAARPITGGHLRWPPRHSGVLLTTTHLTREYSRFPLRDATTCVDLHDPILDTILAEVWGTQQLAA